MAVCTGFEPVISAVTGQHPKPLDERTILVGSFRSLTPKNCSSVGISAKFLETLFKRCVHGLIQATSY